MSVLSNIRRKKSDKKADTAPRQDAAGASNDPKASKPKKKRFSISTLIAVLLVTIGAGLIAYPTFSDWWNSYHQSRAIASYVTAVEETDPKVIEKLFNDARAYNDTLINNGSRFTMTDEERKEYQSVLDLTGTGIMGYIQIASLGVNLPIYHGVEEKYLQVAIGHIEGSSVPVGGLSTHAAVSGHRGLPRAKLFTDLDKMVEGDTFTITVLNKTLTYEVDQIRIVTPDDMSDLAIEQGADYVTLITCTPYGINTHRLLVRGHRIENMTGMVAIPPEGVLIPSYVAVPAVALPMLFVYLVGALLYFRLKRPGLNKERALQELRELEEKREAESAPGNKTVESTEPQASNQAQANDKPQASDGSQPNDELQASEEPQTNEEPDSTEEPDTNEESQTNEE
ncbi:MAG: class C sortase [Atopobiaceae bacterium]|nr:class C sortase [Atopobiaceae bacterium]